jgi:bacterioferritin-associated ferredoxin
MIICVCQRVSHHDIQRLAREGCGSFDDVQMALGVATRCGACRSCAVEHFESARQVCARPPMVVARDMAATLAAA